LAADAFAGDAFAGDFGREPAACALPDFLTGGLANFSALVFGPGDALRVIFDMIGIY
jgi:hypothetical protein